MRVVDTSAWIEVLIGSETGRQLQLEFPPRERCIVPTIVQYELAKWLGRESTEDNVEKVIADTMKSIVADLDSAIALRAAELTRECRLAAADAIVYATAQSFGAQLLTCDAHFKSLPDVLYVPKVAI